MIDFSKKISNLLILQNYRKASKSCSEYFYEQSEGHLESFKTVSAFVKN